MNFFFKTPLTFNLMHNCNIASGRYKFVISLIAIICSLVATWAVCFIPNTATGEIFHGNFYGLLCVLPCLATVFVAFCVWKSLLQSEPELLKTAAISALVVVGCLFWFACDYTSHYDNWYDTKILVENVYCPAQYEVFNLGFGFLEEFTFGFGYLDPFILTLLAYTGCFLIYKFLR